MKARVKPDGTILHAIRVPLGYWEAKDTDDDLDAEIEKKRRKGYPTDNIVYEDSRTAVLIQDGREVARCGMTDVAKLAELLGRFFAWERPEIAEFRKAVAQFRDDLPRVLDALREKIGDAYRDNASFRASAAAFLDHARETINPTLGEADVREMLIQHVLTEEIFTHVFNRDDFHRENNIAQELYRLEAAFFTGAVKQDTLRALRPFYAAIRSQRRADHRAPREAELSEGDLRDLLQGLQPEGRRPARRRLHPERDRALHGRRARTGSARSISAGRWSIRASRSSTRRPAPAPSSAS